MRKIKFRAYDIKLKKWQNNLCVGIQNFKSEDVVFMQYTGLKDKNNKEIFESDIVKAKTDKNKYEYFEIAYYKQAFALRNKSGHKEYLCNLSCFNCLEIIGNIYENPEVLANQ